MVTNKIKKIIFFLDSRATYAYSKNIITHLKKFKKLKYGTVVSGTYLDDKFGDISKNLKIDKIKIDEKVKFKSSSNEIYSWAYNLGEAIKIYSKKLSKLKPHLVILTGDRIETLAFCITCAYMNIPIAHVQAGDKSGHIDDLARASIAKFSNIHFASCPDSQKRLLNFGEEKKRIFDVGAPQLDDIEEFIKLNKLSTKKKLKEILLIFHPVLNENKSISEQFNNIISAAITFDVPINCIYPNNDYGYKKIISLMNKKRFNKKIYIHKNLTRKVFLQLLNKSSIIIGNSSCGIIEAPSFKIPVINIGSRQNGRPQAKNIINCSYDKSKIIKAISFAFNNKKFKNKLKTTKNLFYKKNSGLKICQLINKISNNIELFKKY